MYYNPFLNILMRMMGQAVAGQFSQQRNNQESSSQGFPFDELFGSQGAQQAADDDSPINVEAEVADIGGKSQRQRAHEVWDKQRKAQSGAAALSGTVSFAGSKNYHILVGVICVLLLLGGVVARIYSLVMGCIFSSVVVPVALGAIAGILLGLGGALAMWKLGQAKVPFFGIDLVLVFCSCTLMGWGLLLPTIAAALVCLAAKKLSREGRPFPFLVPYAVVACVQFALLKFPGLY